MRDYLKSKLDVPENWDKYDYQTQRYSFEDVEEILQTFKDEQLRIDDVSKSVNCDHPRSERSYIGGNLLRCNKCGKEFC